jgi:heat-inducible transcriptional repressor
MIPETTDRQRRILARLITEYIEQGEPVSSAWLAEHTDLGLSSASVRNILARLEEQGLLHQPHTSAGRVPTDSGYRLYVDSLLGTRKKNSRVQAEVEARLRRAGTVGDLLENASQELSRASQHIGFALDPASPSVRLRHVDFVRLDARRVLVIVVSTGGQITHKVVEPPDEADGAALTQAANYINTEFAGLTIHEVRTAVGERLRQERILYDALVNRALQLASASLADFGSSDTLHVQGASLLIDQIFGEPRDRDSTLQTLRALFKMIEEKHRLVELLGRYIETDGVTVVIGSENFVIDLHPFSVVACSFSNAQGTGTVGVIGPTRMRYQKAIAVVDGVSQVMTRVLEGQNRERHE